jgi:hypothetical protein
MSISPKSTVSSEVLALGVALAQAAIGAASLPVDVDRIPVDLLLDVLPVEIDQVHAAMTLALAAAANDGSGH